MPAFLLEIGLEEIPAGMIAAAQKELAERVEKLLTRERLTTDALRVTSYSTPRRLAVLVEGLLPGQPDMQEEVVGPATKVAFKDGVPTQAAIAFAKKSGVDVSTLKTIQNAKGEYVAATVRSAWAHGGRGFDGEPTCRDRWNLLAEEHVLARGKTGTICSSAALDGGAAR